MWFGVLGPLVVVDDDERTVPIPSARLRSLLAALLVRSDTVRPVDELIDLVWDGRPPHSARQTLPTYVLRLRRLLGPAVGARIVHSAPGYRLRLAGDELDLHKFTTLCAEGRAVQSAGDQRRARRIWADALRLWRGDPLADVSSDALHRDVERGLVEQWSRAVEGRIEADLRTGPAGDVVPELRDLVHRFPLRERSHCLLMTALFLDGRQGEALAAYQRARSILVEELGVEPGAELSGLHQQVLAGGHALTTRYHAAETPMRPVTPRTVTKPVQLPADVGDFTGRTVVSGQCQSALSQRDAMVLMALTGEGGIGKTTLAVHVVHALAAEFPDGQLFLSLGGSGEAVEPWEAQARLLQDLGLPSEAIPAERDARTGLYRSVLAGRRMLLVLDDARDAAQVRALLPGAVGCSVLVTSRNNLADLEGAQRLTLARMDGQEGYALFARIVGTTRAGAEPDATSAVLAACAGLPMAIRIAGARLATRPNWRMWELADLLGDQGRKLDELAVGDLAVRTCFEGGYAALPPARAAAFRLLGVAALPTIGVSAAAVLFGQCPDAAAATLESLVDVHMVESLGGRRYGLHDLPLAFAADRARHADDQGVRVAAVQRLARWYLRAATRAGLLLDVDTPQPPKGTGNGGPAAVRGAIEALRWWELEHRNVAATIERAAEYGLHQLAWRLPVALWPFDRGRLCPDDWADAYRIALASARSAGSQVGEARVLSCLGG